MTFYREGKKISYLEVIKMIEALIDDNILMQLEESEVCKLFKRVVDFTNEMIVNYLKEIGYQKTNIEEMFSVLEEFKLISSQEVWLKAISIYNNLKDSSQNKEEICVFIQEELLSAMKEIEIKLGKKQHNE